eukprot:CAMPEP_0182915766 /NCGR_PEP_ID=MMETSP0105_2-20130417/529_1 /TAXON_ID=81532 ORGANISM="Acanthoeca-like sp., Strain 10tr" /NCGR_SAMPLE_ID=MMETSP0105_2 /ASSEMBLY_ACC=CAM_ASM_000205 /LENGTH=304 /DNA_ID=CAMNT_0025052655 /DNA_START=911 /DNA_END=1822 /DNA_ORIENTATION=+
MTVNDGKLDDLKALAAEMIAWVQEKEKGTLVYEWYFPDGSEASVVVIERYADSGAFLTHLGNFGPNFGERFMACITPVKIAIFGDASDDLRGALAGFGVADLTFHTNLGGFDRAVADVKASKGCTCVNCTCVSCTCGTSCGSGGCGAAPAATTTTTVTTTTTTTTTTAAQAAPAPAPTSAKVPKSSDVWWTVEFTVNEGKLADFKSVIAEIAGYERGIPGSLQWECYFADGEEKKGIFHERYVDADAALAHLANFGEKIAERFMPTCTPTSLKVYGPTTEELRKALATFELETGYHQAIEGFAW